MKFCCSEIKRFLDNPDDPVSYNKVFREFYIDCEGTEICLTLDYCPWCGNKFPNSLRNEYFEILDNEYSIDISISEIKTHKNIPEEFKTDEWWKKRGL